MMSIDTLCINTIRTLAADVVQKANSGHPGAPMGLAPAAHVLFSRFLKFSSKNPNWISRDRFVLSNGHACALQYIMLHLLGYDLTMDDLKKFRQLDSKTPGHPESHMTSGIEVTTGPLGQGVSNAVGLAIAEAHLAATFNKPGYKIFDNYTFAVVGDGCLQEGVSAEALSLAGHLGLDKLIVLYDDNNVTIDGDTAVSFTEDVTKRMESYGFNVFVVTDGDNNLSELDAAISAAQRSRKPSFIKIKTTIGFGSKNQGSEKVHGSPLGPEDVSNLKKALGFDPVSHFVVPESVYSFYSQISQKLAAAENEWNLLFSKYTEEYPTEAAEIKRRFEGKLPDGWKSKLPSYTPKDPEVATRKLSENVLNAICAHIPELVGGSADLTGSNLTKWKNSIDFQNDNSKLGSFSGRYFRFGVREHGMFAIMNGIAAYGGLIPFGGTFLNFITYGWGAVRLSALSNFQVLYIMTHDSIGLGEDGPTHQPIETVAALRALPNIYTLRPCDGNEVSGSYIVALESRDTPSVLCLSRQNLPHLQGTSPEKVWFGAYEITMEPNPQVVIVSTGSEVSICYQAAEILKSKAIKVRIVSMPCCELFEKQSVTYKKSVFPEQVPVLSVEALSTFGWHQYAHASIGMKEFGASAPYKEIYKKVGIYPENIAEKAEKLIEFYRGKSVPDLISRPF